MSESKVQNEILNAIRNKVTCSVNLDLDEKEEFELLFKLLDKSKERDILEQAV